MNQDQLDELYTAAMELHDQGDFEGAFRLFMQGAEQGDANAMNMVGLAYDDGHFVPQDKAKAIEWLKKAHRTKPQTYLCMNIALIYSQMGRRRQAVYWWNKAIAQNDASAKWALAQFLLQERGGKPTPRIWTLVRQAAEATVLISPAEQEDAQELLAMLERDFAHNPDTLPIIPDAPSGVIPCSD